MRVYPQQAQALIIVSIIFPILAFTTILLRVRSKQIARKGIDASDYFLFATMLIALGNAVTCIVGATNAGLGEQLDSLTSATEVGFMKILFATQFFYIFSVITVKIAILLFYKAIFSTSTAFCKAANAILILLGAWITAFFLITLFQDKPISRNWGTEGTTVNFPALYIAESVTDITLDLVILAMPIPVIHSLQISAKKRWLLSGIFWLGVFCVVASTLRLYYMIRFRSAYTARTDDFSHTVVNWIIWGAIEPCTSIIAACLPTLAPVLLPYRRTPTKLHSYSLQRGSGNGIRAETSVHVGRRTKDSMEHLELGVGMVNRSDTLTEVEAGGVAIPKAVLMDKRARRVRIPSRARYEC